MSTCSFININKTNEELWNGEMMVESQVSFKYNPGRHNEEARCRPAGFERGGKGPKPRRAALGAGKAGKQILPQNLQRQHRLAHTLISAL